MPCLLKAHADEEVEVRGNALYATGLAFALGSPRVLGHVQSTLAALAANLELPTDDGETVRTRKD